MKNRTKNNKTIKSQPQPPSLNSTPDKKTEEKQVFLSEDEINDIWNVLGSLPANEAEEFLKNFPQEVIEKIRVAKNPFKLPVFKGSDNRWLICTALPISEIYQKRLAMTSLVGYTFRMADEYKPKKLEYLPSEESQEFQVVFDKHIRVLELERPNKEFEKKTRMLQLNINAVNDQLNSRGTDFLKSPGETLEFQKKNNYEDWFKLSGRELADMLNNFQKELLETKAMHLLYKMKVLNNYCTDVKIKKQGMEKKIKETTSTVEQIAKTLEQQKLLLDDFEQLYQKNPELEPMDTSDIPVKKVRSENTTDPKPMKTRKSIREAIAYYEQKLTEYQNMLAKANSDNLELADILQKKTNEFYDIKKNSLELLKVEYYKAYGNPNGAPKVAKKSKKTGELKKTLRDKNPWNNVFDHLDFDCYELIDEDYQIARDLTKKELNIDKTYEEETEKIQEYISDFLSELFVYNPDNHVVCGYKPNYEDPERTPLEVGEIDGRRKILEKEYERSLLPPSDTFARWQRYMDNNYEQLRQATDDIYCEKSDLESNIVPLDVFDEVDVDNAKARFSEFCRKYRKEFEAEPRLLKFRVNNLIAPWQQNRERIDFYNENTEIIKRIIDQHKQDSKIGPELMKDRIERKRAKNIQVAGEKDVGLKSYKEQVGGKLENYGVKQPSDITESSIPKDHKEPAYNEIEMRTHVIKPHKTGRRIYGKSKRIAFNTPAKDPEGEMALKTAAEHQLAELEKK